MKKAILHRYDNKLDILAVEANHCSDVYTKAIDDDFDLVIVIPTKGAKTELVVYGEADGGQYVPTEPKEWPNAPEKPVYRTDIKNISFTSAKNVRAAVKAAGNNWLGAWTVRVIEIDDTLL